MDVSSGPGCVGADEATDRIPTGRVIVEGRVGRNPLSRPHRGMRLGDVLLGSHHPVSDVVVESTADPSQGETGEAVRGVVSWLLA